MSSSRILISSENKNDTYDETPLVVYCLPVSGGGFVAQCGLLSEIYEAKWIMNGRKYVGSKGYQPNIVLSSSGGNIASYIAMAGDWSPEGIMRVATKIKSSMFIKSWLPKCLSFIPSWMVGIFNGSIYKPGCGSEYLFQTLYTPVSVQKTEIWTGTYDHTNRKAQFFCNLSRGKSLIQPDYFNDSSYFHGCMPLNYLGGDIDKISSAIMASASIPIVSSRKEMDGFSYSDGGVMYASPASVMMPEIHRLIMGKGPYKDNNCSSSKIIVLKGDEKKIDLVGKRPLRLFYFCSYEMDSAKNKHSISFSFSSPFSQLLHANALLDRSAVINLIYQIAGENPEMVVVEHHPRLNKKQLADLLTTLETKKHYIIVLYPHGSHYIPLQGFKEIDIKNNINNSRHRYGARVWYLHF